MIDAVASALFAICLCLLVLIAVTDARTGFIPDTFSIPFILFACIRALLIGPFPWLPILIAIVFFGGQWVISKGKWIGGADVMIACGISFLLPRTDLFILSLFVTYIVGGIVAGFLMMSGKNKKGHAVPFVPFLSAGTLIVLLFK